MSGDDGEDGEDEAALFRAAVRGVRPLKDSGQLTPARGGTRVRAALGRAQRAAALRESQQRASSPVHAVDGTDLYELQPGDELVFRRAGVPETVLRRLRRGQYHIDEQIDLHGCTLAQASPALESFLREARQRGLHCVRIVHGKGLRSGNRGPVLKNWVNAQLRQADEVLAFASARPEGGGTGATLVLLARA